MEQMANMERVLKRLKYIPVVTFTENDDVERFADFLLDQGVSCIEITLRTPFAMQAIRNLKNAYGDRLIIGAGTVTHVDQILELKKIGVDFLVCPGLIRELFDAATKASIPFLPGVATPTEIMYCRMYPRLMVTCTEYSKALKIALTPLAIVKSAKISVKDSSPVLGFVAISSITG